MYWFILEMAARAGSRPGQSWEPGPASSSPVCAWAVIQCSSRRISRKLIKKQGRWTQTHAHRQQLSPLGSSPLQVSLAVFSPFASQISSAELVCCGLAQGRSGPRASCWHECQGHKRQAGGQGSRKWQCFCYRCVWFFHWEGSFTERRRGKDFSSAASLLSEGLRTRLPKGMVPSYSSEPEPPEKCL